MKTWSPVLVVILTIVAVIGVQVYQSQPVEVKAKTQVLCSDSKHRGNPLIREYEKNLSVARRRAQKATNRTEYEVCTTCLLRQQAEKRAVKERAEAEEVTRHLKWSFGFLGQFGQRPNEIKLSPGRGISFELYVKNHSSEPISDLRVIIQPAEYLGLQPNQSMGPNRFDRLMIDENKRNDREDARQLKRMTTTGLPIYDTSGKNVIFPSNHPYYRENEAHWIAGFRLFGDPGKNAWFHGNLILNANLKPGQDVYFQGYLVLKGQKIPLGTLTVHVMYPE